MNVEQLMTRNVQTCHAGDPLNAAAQIMWERNCGCVPVVEQEDGAARLVGMITDRDICMAAYTQGQPLSSMPVAIAMAKEVCVCQGTDSIDTALKILQGHQLHRLPVLDQDNHLIGLLSLADVAREAMREHGREVVEITDTQVGDAVEAICAARAPEEMAAT
jgi:CBS domain-containing protein